MKFVCYIIFDYRCVRQSKATDILDRDKKSVYNFWYKHLKTLLLRYNNALEYLSTGEIMGIQKIDHDFFWKKCVVAIC